MAPAAPAEPQPAPPEETAPEGVGPAIPATAAGVAAQAPGDWQPARVPSVFDTRALPALYPGQVRRYRVSFRGPATPRGFSWLLRFESVRRNAGVFLNGRRIGRNVDPYTPFTVEARGLRPGRRNELVGDRRRAQGPGPARGMVELEWDRPAGEAGAQQERRTSRTLGRCRA